MTFQQWLDHATKQLVTHHITTARLDALILLEDVSGQDRASLLAHPERKISHSDLLILNKKVAQRATHRPLAYIRGMAHFYGRSFFVNEHVLVPRPESEAIITLLKSLGGLPSHPRIADIGTGSGCLGLTAGLEVPGSAISLYDIDTKALAVATSNARALKVSVQTEQANLVSKLEAHYDIVLANLPYVPLGYSINAAARFEPSLALFAGQDGLDTYRQIWQQLKDRLNKPSYVITEALAFQHDQNQALAAVAGYQLESRLDLAQCFVASPQEKLRG